MNVWTWAKAGVLTLLLCMGAGLCSAASDLEVTAKSAIVMEAATGKVLYAKDAESERYPASTTKMMTLILALEHGNLNEVVEASEAAASTEGSSLWLEKGEQLTLRDLLYGIMLVSGNDATVAVAEHIAGSVENFAKLMTDKAHRIGADQTFFVNSSGLPDPRHVSTAHDLAKIAAYGYQNPLFEEIVSTKTKIIPWASHTYGRELFNENRMLWQYNGGNGVKTGYTEAAGRCLVSAAKRDGMQLIAVVLDSDFMWSDSIALLDYGFSKVKPVRMFTKGEIVKDVPVIAGKKSSSEVMVNKDIILPLTEEDQEAYVTVVELPEKLEAGFREGDKVGTLKIFLNDKEIAKSDLVAKETVERKSILQLICRSFSKVFSQLLNRLSIAV